MTQSDTCLLLTSWFWQLTHSKSFLIPKFIYIYSGFSSKHQQQPGLWPSSWCRCSNFHINDVKAYCCHRRDMLLRFPFVANPCWMHACASLSERSSFLVLPRGWVPTKWVFERCYEWLIQVSMCCCYCYWKRHWPRKVCQNEMLALWRWFVVKAWLFWLVNVNSCCKMCGEKEWGWKKNLTRPPFPSQTVKVAHFALQISVILSTSIVTFFFSRINIIETPDYIATLFTSDIMDHSAQKSSVRWRISMQMHGKMTQLNSTHIASRNSYRKCPKGSCWVAQYGPAHEFFLRKPLAISWWWQ